MADSELHHLNVQMLLGNYGRFLQSVGYDIHGSDNKLRLPTSIAGQKETGNAILLGPHTAYSAVNLTRAFLVQELYQLYLESYGSDTIAKSAALNNLQAIAAYNKAGLLGSIDPGTGLAQLSKLVLNANIDGANRGFTCPVRQSATRHAAQLGGRSRRRQLVPLVAPRHR